MIIAIVGGGLSLADVALDKIQPRHDVTIAINDTAWLMPCDLCFTLSLKFAVRKQFGMGQPFGFVLAKRNRHPATYPCETVAIEEGGIPDTWPEEARQHAINDGGKTGLSDTQGIVHGGNSAYAALNWAYLRGATHINFFGIDATDDHRLAGKSGKHSHLPLLFESAVPQLNNKNITVINYSPESLVQCFDKRGLHDYKND